MNKGNSLKLFSSICTCTYVFWLSILSPSLTLFQDGDGLIHLYQKFIIDFETKINLLKVAHFAILVSRQYPMNEASISYLEGVIQRVRATKKCKKLLEYGKSTLDRMANIDPSVCTQFYWASVLYHKYQKEYFECYMNVMLFLAYASEESMSHSFKLDLAYCVSVFALLGENIDNFGELLAHPIIKGLQGTELDWFYEFLKVFNS
uniref:PSD13 N-terminal domain-containing protein n=1 Tax=Helianthus annuus TaxID=4232 RepID=A0A251T3X3_HELAN